MTKKSVFLTLYLLMLPLMIMAVISDIKFRRLDTRDGLTNSQVNSILRDAHGNVWLGTQFGLCRYDGYRFKTFYSYERDTTTLRSHRVDEIQEDYFGNLWIDHGMNFSLYDPVTESVNRSPTTWLGKHGIRGGAESLAKGKVLWKDDFVKKSLNSYNDYWIYVDKDGLIWVITHSVGTYIYVPQEKRWYTNLTDLMRARGFAGVPDEIVVWEVRYDQKGLLWVATDHLGVLLLDFANKEWRQFTNVKGDETSLPDITAKHLYQDQLGRMWVATYKNGVAMSSDAMTNFNSLALGDINGICEDKAEQWWTVEVRPSFHGSRSFI